MAINQIKRIALHFQDSNNSGGRISKILSEMTVEERLFLDYFFRDLIFNNGGGYVLSGTKPVALGGPFFPELRSSMFYGNRLFNKSVRFKKGYEVWKKYEKSFPMTRYLLICNEDREKELFNVIFIHKEALKKVFIENSYDFQAVLGKEVTLESVFDKIREEKKSFYEALGEHSGLEGIALGFGRHNSWLFYQRDLLSNRNLDYRAIPKKAEYIEKKIEEINKRLYPFPSKETALSLAKSLGFLSDPKHPETDKLEKKYAQTRREFTRFYKNQNFLERTLQELTS